MISFRTHMLNLNKNTSTAELMRSVEKAYAKSNFNDKAAIFSPKSIKGNVLDGQILLKNGWTNHSVKFKTEKLAQKHMEGLRATHYKNGLIVANAEKAGLSYFHEMGHALNARSGASKFLKKLKFPGAILALTIPVLALMFPKKSDNSNKDSFIKQHATGLALLAGAPMLIEEGLATVKGNKLAKEFCSDKIYKNVVKNNRYGFLSYLTAGAAVALISHFISKSDNK